MKHNNIEMSVLIKSKPITEYQHNGHVFVEGRSGSNFEIELVNRNPFKVEAIVSVDGLSIIDGKEAGPGSAGYLLAANETVRIPGWKLNNEEVAAFEFSDPDKSYAEQSTGSAVNTGVIGVLAYKEKPRHYFSGNFTAIANPLRGYDHGHFSGAPVHGYGGLDPSYGCIGGGWVEPTHTYLSAPLKFGLTNLNVATCVANCMVTNTISSAAASPPASFHAPADDLGDASGAVTNNLGTGFGERTSFETTAVSFERGDLHCMAVVYYDDAKGLRHRGIVLERRKAKRPSRQPQAFPGMGCQPPKGWRG